jgi:VanZ family protein
MNKIRYSIQKPSMIRLFWIVLVVSWMALIYYKSNEPYQDQDIRPLLATWFPPSSLENWLPHLEFWYSGEFLTWKEPYIMLEFFFRKSAHVMEYAVLMMLWFKVLRYTALIKSRLYISIMLTILFAASDEWHQSFIVGRTGHAIDVAVDSVGVLIITLLWLGWRWRNRHKGDLQS